MVVGCSNCCLVAMNSKVHEEINVALENACICIVLLEEYKGEKEELASLSELLVDDCHVDE